MEPPSSAAFPTEMRMKKRFKTVLKATWLSGLMLAAGSSVALAQVPSPFDVHDLWDGADCC